MLLFIQDIQHMVCLARASISSLPDLLLTAGQSIEYPVHPAHSTNYSKYDTKDGDDGGEYGKVLIGAAISVWPNDANHRPNSDKDKDPQSSYHPEHGIHIRVSREYDC